MEQSKPNYLFGQNNGWFTYRVSGLQYSSVSNTVTLVTTITCNALHIMRLTAHTDN